MLQSRKRAVVALFVLAGLGLNACAPTRGVVNAPGTPTTYQDSGTRGAVGGVGIESQDIVSMTDEMMRDMLTNPKLASASPPPRVIIDAKHFRNQSSQRIDKDLIVDRLRIGLQRAAKGRIIFVGREYVDVVEKERDLKRAGKVDVATTGFTKATAGADYRLTGRIKTLDARSSSTGAAQRYNQITFEMVDLEYGTIVWGGFYEFTKAGQDDVIYR